MTDFETRDNPRRVILRLLAKLMLWVSLIMAAWIILSPLFKPSVPVNAKDEETAIEMAAFAPDSIEVIEWFDKPLIIARRTAAVLAQLESAPRESLQDPEGVRSVQPEYAANAVRSAHDEWFVAIGIGTSSGCALSFIEPSSEGLKSVVLTDPCDGSRYDLAGRALVNSHAKKNLPVPHWRVDGARLKVSTRRVGN